MANTYIAKIEEDGKLSIYTKTKKFFKERLVKVDLNDFFSLGKKSFFEKGTYHIAPYIQGMSNFSYLYQKALYNLNRKESDFGQRVIWDLQPVDSKTEEFETEGFKFYHGVIKAKITIKTESGTPIFVGDNYTFEYIDTFEMDTNTLRLLNQNASNGCFQSARETFELIDFISKKQTGQGARLRCEECGEIFDSIPAFFCHLIETGHHDSVLDEHPFDPEVKRIKQVIERERA